MESKIKRDTVNPMNNAGYIRLATIADCAMIQECAALAYAVYVDRIGKKPAPMIADFRTHIAKREAVVLVAKADSSILGYAIYYPENDSLFLENIALRPDQQGRGFGNQLLAHVHDFARRGGFTSVELYTNELMSENLRWYAKRGYDEVSRCREDGFSRVYFTKIL